jgi:preprotein translocase SecE subunit
MAVAVKKESEVGLSGPALGLAEASLLGAFYGVLGFILVFHAIPWLWYSMTGEPAQTLTLMHRGLRVLGMGVAAAAWIYLWPHLFRPQPGLRAGVFVALMLLVLGAVILYWLCALLNAILPVDLLGENRPYLGLAIAVSFALLWLRFLWSRLHRETFQRRLHDLEEQGWFTLKPFKKGQGLRARRFTMLGILILAGAGLWVYRFALGGGILFDLPWGSYRTVRLPFTNGYELPIFLAPGIIIPALLCVLTVWLAFRLVNYPRFADFLIATEAEMNKVSWSSQKRLVQDTIVVLTTVVLMAVFLLAMDLFWSFVLSAIGVIQ